MTPIAKPDAVGVENSKLETAESACLQLQHSCSQTVWITQTLPRQTTLRYISNFSLLLCKIQTLPSRFISKASWNFPETFYRQRLRQIQNWFRAQQLMGLGLAVKVNTR